MHSPIGGRDRFGEVGIGRLHAGARLLMLVHELDIHVIAEDTGELLRAFTLDPTRDYQPQTHSTA